MKLITVLETAFNAVIPIVLLIALGYLLRKKGVMDKNFVKIGNKLVFNIFLPAMLFINVYEIESMASIRWDVVLYCIPVVLLIFGLCIVTIPLSSRVAERRGVILQAAVRSNTAIIGLTLSSTLGGPEAVAVAAILSAFAVPTMNILAVIALTLYVSSDGQNKPSIKSVLRNVAKNPLILSIAAGLVCLVIRWLETVLFGDVVFSLRRDVKILYTCLNNLKSIASPLALLILGGQFEFGATRGFLREIVAGTLWRVVIAPVIAIGGAVLLSAYTPWLNFGINEYPALVAQFCTPVAVSSAIMAGQMGNDEQLATQLVVWSSVVSVFTMFFTVCLLMYGGLLAT
jgi:predicted permease